MAEEHEGPIDLVLTDVVMPVMNGPRLVRRIRKLRPGIRILYMSGYALETLVDEAEVAVPEPGIRMIKKPFGKVELADVVRGILDDAAGSPSAEPRLS